MTTLFDTLIVDPSSFCKKKCKDCYLKREDNSEDLLVVDFVNTIYEVLSEGICSKVSIGLNSLSNRCKSIIEGLAARDSKILSSVHLLMNSPTDIQHPYMIYIKCLGGFSLSTATVDQMENYEFNSAMTPARTSLNHTVSPAHLGNLIGVDRVVQLEPYFNSVNVNMLKTKENDWNSIDTYRMYLTYVNQLQELFSDRSKVVVDRCLVGSGYCHSSIVYLSPRGEVSRCPYGWGSFEKGNFARDIIKKIKSVARTIPEGKACK